MIHPAEAKGKANPLGSSWFKIGNPRSSQSLFPEFLVVFLVGPANKQVGPSLLQRSVTSRCSSGLKRTQNYFPLPSWFGCLICCLPCCPLRVPTNKRWSSLSPILSPRGLEVFGGWAPSSQQEPAGLKAVASCRLYSSLSSSQRSCTQHFP